MNNDQFESMLSRVFDYDLSADEFAEFEQYLLGSPDARARYMEYVDLHNLLNLEIEKSVPVQLGTSKVVDIKRIIRRQKRRTMKIAAFAAAAVVVLGLVAMQLFFVKDTPPTLAFVTAPGTQFALTHNGASNTPEGLILEKGSRLQLSQGTVELTFASGVKSIVMAPADVTLHDDDTLFLNRGTAWFHVPTEAIGFTVKTKDLDIVDLGTEFGVIALPDQHHEVHVFKGKVEVTAQRVRKEAATLIAGDARRIDPVGRLTVIPPTPDSFITTLPNSLPYLHWSFDKEDGYQVSGTHPTAKTLKVNLDSKPAFSEGKVGNALSLNGNSQYLATDWPGFTGDRPRTVSFWLKIPANGDYHLNPGIIGWGDRTLKSGKWKITLANLGPNTPSRARLSWGRSWLTSNASLATDQWHHITVASKGDLNTKGIPDVDFYIDGEVMPTTLGGQSFKDAEAPSTSTTTSQSVPMMIGCDLYPDPGKRNFFLGEIDELNIFDGYMTAEEVKQIPSLKE